MLHIDRVDAQILERLQDDGRVSQHELARSVGLSAPAVAERLRKLEERGIIERFTAVLNARALGWDIAAFILVGMGGSRYFPEFRTRVAELPEVQECHSVTGNGSHLLKVRVANTAGLEALLAQIQSWPGVQWTTTSLVLSTLKETLDVAVPATEPPSGRADGPQGPGDLIHVPFRHTS
jgi:Lrp/AsnC family transcriptional regulator, leucine-responsive regulatory protein